MLKTKIGPIFGMTSLILLYLALVGFLTYYLLQHFAWLVFLAIMLAILFKVIGLIFFEKKPILEAFKYVLGSIGKMFLWFG